MASGEKVIILYYPESDSAILFGEICYMPVFDVNVVQCLRWMNIGRRSGEQGMFYLVN